MDMIKSAKSSHEDEDEDDDVFVIKKEPSPHHRGLSLAHRMLTTYTLV